MDEQTRGPGRVRPPTSQVGAFVVVLLATLVPPFAGCDREAPPPRARLTRRAAQLDPDAIADRPPTGTLGETPFRFREARWKIDRRPGRERLEIWLSEEELPRCGLPGHDLGRRLWFRIPRVTELRPGTWRVDPGQRRAPMSIHYELQEGHRWIGRAGGAAVLRIDAVGELGEIQGRTHVCFDDGWPSCVQGRFRAMPCVSRVDGNAIRELPVRGRAEPWQPEGDE